MSDAEGNDTGDSREDRIRAAMRYLYQAEASVGSVLDADAESLDMDLLDAWSHIRNAQGRLRIWRDEGKDEGERGHDRG